jgi:protease-4
VEKIAKGRIWTGEDAKRLGLVDELGGFPEALRLVRKAAKLSENAPVRLKVYPQATMLSQLAARLGLAAGETDTESALARMLEDVQPAVKALESLGFSSRSDVLRAPGLD